LGVKHVEPDGTVWEAACVSSEDGPILLHRLVNKRVAEVQREDLLSTIVFDDGAQLHILSDASHYEVGQIYVGERLIVF
jgi:hypothetical protein